jgi:hypothetical protein
MEMRSHIAYVHGLESNGRRTRHLQLELKYHIDAASFEGSQQMRASEFIRFGLSISVAAALLSACGGSSVPIATNNPTSNTGAAKKNKTFKYTGKEQTFVVPAGVTQITVIAIGGEGGGFNVYPSTAPPGRPGRVYAIIPIQPGKKLYVFVGGSGTEGGFNGGGAGGAPYSTSSYAGNPGGGASDVRTGGNTLPERIIVAAGGGGAGEATDNYADAYGGNGGGLVGKSGGSSSNKGSGGGGGGGTQSAGGAGGAGGNGLGCYGSGSGQPGGTGALGLGGSGGQGSQYSTGGGGGGGGYYGGGGGGGASFFFCYNFNGQSGGGGGGSSYVEPSAIKSRMWTGWKSKGDGLVVFSWN